MSSRAYCFTLNNWTQEEYDHITSGKFDYLILGKEIAPETGTPHIQGYVYKASKITLVGIKKLLGNRAHFEVSKGSPQQNYTYCSKSKDFIEIGVLPSQGKRSDLDDIKELLKSGGNMRDVVDVACSYQSVRMAESILKYKEKPRNWKPYIEWVHGPTECGKSRYAYEKMPNAYSAASTGKWWEGYDGHEDVIIDEMRSDFLKFHELLRLLDRYEYRVECKGGSRQFLAKRIIITSCYPPEILFQGIGENLKQLFRRIDKIISHDSL